MKKVLFIYQDDSLPSSRIRVLNLIPEVKNYGIIPTVIRGPKTLHEKLEIFKMLKQFDIIYIQKKLFTPYEVWLYRKNAKRLVFDFDDAIYYRDDAHGASESRTRHLKFRYLLKNVDLVVAGNRVLSDYARQFNDNVTIIPSAVETRNIPVKDYQTLSGVTVIGWIGGKGNLHHLEMLLPVLQRLSKDYKIQLNIVSNDTISAPGVDICFIPWSLETQEKEIALFDIGIMPLPNNKWTEGKCGYKALQYMAAAVPPVCSDVGINREIVENGKEGFVVSSQDEFYKALSAFINNKGMRREMGLNARIKVERQFSIHVVAKKLADFLHCLI